MAATSARERPLPLQRIRKVSYIMEMDKVAPSLDCIAEIRIYSSSEDQKDSFMHHLYTRHENVVFFLSFKLKPVNFLLHCFQCGS